MVAMLEHMSKDVRELHKRLRQTLKDFEKEVAARPPVLLPGGLDLRIAVAAVQMLENDLEGRIEITDSDDGDFHHVVRMLVMGACP